MKTTTNTTNTTNTENTIATVKKSNIDLLLQDEKTTKQDVLTCIVDTLKNKKDSTTNILQSCQNDLISLIIKYNDLNKKAIKKKNQTKLEKIYSNKPLIKDTFASDAKKTLQEYLVAVYNSKKTINNETNAISIKLDNDDFKFLVDKFVTYTDLPNEYIQKIHSDGIKFKFVKDAICTAFAKQMTGKGAKNYGATALVNKFFVCLQSAVIGQIDNPNKKENKGGKK